MCTLVDERFIRKMKISQSSNESPTNARLTVPIKCTLSVACVYGITRPTHEVHSIGTVSLTLDVHLFDD